MNTKSNNRTPYDDPFFSYLPSHGLEPPSRLYQMYERLRLIVLKVFPLRTLYRYWMRRSCQKAMEKD